MRPRIGGFPASCCYRPGFRYGTGIGLVIAKTFFMAKTFRAMRANYLRQEKSLRDLRSCAASRVAGGVDVENGVELVIVGDEDAQKAGQSD
jgi:hypothetical protein